MSMGMILLNEQFYLFQDLGIQKGTYFPHIGSCNLD